MTSGTIVVEPAALDTAAQHSSDLAACLRPVAGIALATGLTVGEALTGWSLSDALVGLVDSWRPALDALATGLDANAAALRANSAACGANELATARRVSGPADR